MHYKLFLFYTAAIVALINPINTTTKHSNNSFKKKQEQTKLTSEQLKTLSKKERTTNLIIINDTSEYNNSYMNYMMDYAEVGAMHTELITALSTDQLTLCPKSLWCSIQNIVNTIEKKEFSPETPYAEKFSKLQSLYKQLLASSKDRDVITKSLNEYKKEIQNDTNITTTMKKMFSVYMHYQDILTKQYSCKNVSDEFILFLPSDSQHKSETPAMQDALLGLSVSNLNDYDYKQPLSNEENNQIIDDGLKINKEQSLGRKLLKALKTLKYDNDQLPIESRSWLNAYITGHGEANYTAQMSTVAKKGQKSDFLNIINSFNNDFRTKSIALSSCYTGGKKIIDSYDIENKFNTTALENINFPIINVGSTFEKTLTESLTVFNEEVPHFSPSTGLYKPSIQDLFKPYFTLMNEVPPKYQEALKFLSQGFTENFASIKLQHTAWFSPVEYQKEVKELSQIAMSTRSKSININTDIKIITLSANYIAKPLIFNHYYSILLPRLLPINYHNQNYYFESIQMPNIEESFQDIFKYFVNCQIQEPINIICKQLETKLQKLSNIHIFTHQKTDIPDEYETGYIYTNNKGETKKAAWPSKQKMPENIEEKTINAELSLERMNKIENQIKENLSPSLKPDFLKELALNLNRAKKTTPQKDIESLELPRPQSTPITTNITPQDQQPKTIPKSSFTVTTPKSIENKPMPAQQQRVNSLEFLHPQATPTSSTTIAKHLEQRPSFEWNATPKNTTVDLTPSLQQQAIKEYAGKRAKETRIEKYVTRAKTFDTQLQHLLIHPENIQTMNKQDLQTIDAKIQAQKEIEERLSRNIFYRGERSGRLINQLHSLHNQIQENLIGK